MFTRRAALLAAGLFGQVPQDRDDPSLWKIQGELFLDWQIKKLVALGLRPLIVLGQNGDDLLLQSKLIHDLDLVFDSQPEINLSTQLWSSLADEEGDYFVLPLGTPCPEREIWGTLDFAAHSLKKDSSQLLYGNSSSFYPQNLSLSSSEVTAVSNGLAPINQGWPLLIPKRAVKMLRADGARTCLKKAIESGLGIGTEPRCGAFQELNTLLEFETWQRHSSLTLSPTATTY